MRCAPGEAQAGERVRCDQVDALGDLEARGVGFDRKGRDAASAGCLAGAHEHHVQIGDAAVGDPGFFAVDDAVVGCYAAGAGHRGHVGSGVGL
jgi:hypothetical protein